MNTTILCLAVLLWPLALRAGQTSAPNGPGISFPWATSEKQGFGTAYEAYDPQLQYSAQSPTAPLSKVWFTIARGILTESFFPRLDMAQSRDTQVVISDGRSFTHQEQFDTVHEVERLGNAPLYRIKNRDRWNRYTIEKEIWVDPDSDTLIQKMRITRNVEGLKFFILHKPTGANTIFGDTAYANPFIAGENHHTFGAWQGLASSIGFSRTSVGYVGVNDGFTDLQDFKWDHNYDQAGPGNIAMTGELPIPPTAGVNEFTLFLVFNREGHGVSEKLAAVNQLDLNLSRSKFISQWDHYFSTLSLPITTKTNGRRRELLVQSVLNLKAAEDKTYAGSIIASPSHPWGEEHFEYGPSQSVVDPGYHVVWPRDLYHASSAFIALSDLSTATATLNRLKVAQYQEKDGSWSYGPRSHERRGSFPQNFWVDGKALYGGYQADETAMPLLLAYRLWKKGAVSLNEVWPLVRDAAHFLSEMGPWTQTERWEENYGISPNSAAYVISAMVAASEMAYQQQQNTLGQRYLEQADSWAMKSGDNIDTWTFTHNGKIQSQIGNGSYYLRLSGARCQSNGSPIYDAVWDPNNDGLMMLANFQGPEKFKYESEIVDAGFLALVRLGVRSAKAHPIRESLQETDSLLKRETRIASGWYRYRFDGYGENKRGRLWPILTGERLHYELQWLKENLDPNLQEALESRVKGFESFANEQGVFSEQVWDEGPLAGKPTGSASPLSWSHAEYIQLLRSLYDGVISDEIPAVRARYGR